MTTHRPFDPAAILRSLCEHGVAFIIIGGFACEVHGVAHSTGDVDILIEVSRANAVALVNALEKMHAHHARLPGSHQHIPPTLQRIETATGDLHFDTDFGRLDVSKESGGHTFASLRNSHVLTASLGGHDILIADLRVVADMKTKA